jgi:hypothetical protein
MSRIPNTILFVGIVSVAGDNLYCKVITIFAFLGLPFYVT